MMEQFQIQRLAQHDIQEAGNLIREVISGAAIYCAEAIQEDIQKYTDEYIGKLIREDRDAVIIAKSPDQKIVGFCINHFDSGTIWIDWCGVHPLWRGKNIGLMLLDVLTNTARQRGAHKIWCDSLTNNLASISVLKKAGFQEICKIYDHWYHQDYALFQKFL